MLTARKYPVLILIALIAADKLAAKLRVRRVPEATLVFLAVACGGFGAVLGAVALGILNHKTRKRSFQLKYAAATLAALVLDEYVTGR